MISKDKTYRTRDGREVRIYATDGSRGLEIHGAMLTDKQWHHAQWAKDGRVWGDDDCPADLIEVKPRIKREYWVNVYPEQQGATVGLPSKTIADDSAHHDRIACVKVVIDCEEGEGL